MNKMSESEQLFTFEDVELYCPVRYRGKSGYVVDKGHIMPGSDDPMVRIKLDEKPHHGAGKQYILSRSSVNRHLKEQERFWADFGWHLTGQ